MYKVSYEINEQWKTTRGEKYALPTTPVPTIAINNRSLHQEQQQQHRPYQQQQQQRIMPNRQPVPASTTFLGPKETFEMYENKSQSSHSGAASPVGSHGRRTVTAIFPPTKAKKPFPLCLVVTIAVSVPILIMIILFCAVWFQELGFF